MYTVLWWNFIGLIAYSIGHNGFSVSVRILNKICLVFWKPTKNRKSNLKKTQNLSHTYSIKLFGSVFHQVFWVKTDVCCSTFTVHIYNNVIDKAVSSIWRGPHQVNICNSRTNNQQYKQEKFRRQNFKKFNNFICHKKIYHYFHSSFFLFNTSCFIWPHWDSSGNMCRWNTVWRNGADQWNMLLYATQFRLVKK